MLGTIEVNHFLETLSEVADYQVPGINIQVIE